MEKIREVYKTDKIVKYYRFNNNIVVDDISKIIETLSVNGVNLNGFRLSNNEEQPEHFQRLFYNVRDLMLFSTSDRYISDFGVFCNYKNKRFDLTFDLEENVVLTFSDGTIDLEPILENIELATKKKSR